MMLLFCISHAVNIFNEFDHCPFGRKCLSGVSLANEVALFSDTDSTHVNKMDGGESSDEREAGEDEESEDIQDSGTDRGQWMFVCLSVVLMLIACNSFLL